MSRLFFVGVIHFMVLILYVRFSWIIKNIVMASFGLTFQLGSQESLFTQQWLGVLYLLNRITGFLLELIKVILTELLKALILRW